MSLRKYFDSSINPEGASSNPARADKLFFGVGQCQIEINNNYAGGNPIISYYAMQFLNSLIDTLQYK